MPPQLQAERAEVLHCLAGSEQFRVSALRWAQPGTEISEKPVCCSEIYVDPVYPGVLEQITMGSSRLEHRLVTDAAAGRSGSDDHPARLQRSGSPRRDGGAHTCRQPPQLRDNPSAQATVVAPWSRQPFRDQRIREAGPGGRKMRLGLIVAWPMSPFLSDVRRTKSEPIRRSAGQRPILARSRSGG